jgi:hypothetical protein
MKERTTLAVCTFAAGLLLLTACAGDATAEATVTFSGDTCTYAGASTFDDDTELTIELVNEPGTSMGLGVWKVPDGTTIEDIEEQGMLVVGGDRIQNMRGHLGPGSVGLRSVTVELDESGTWAINCFELEPLPLGVDFLAAIVTAR